MLKRFPISIRRLHAASIALLASAGLYILYTYLYYLNHIPRPLAPHPESAEWGYVKLAVFLSWLTAVLLGVRLCVRRFAGKGYRIERAAIARSLLAGIAFCVSVTAYDPPRVDLTSYFFVNSIGYAMVMYALFSVRRVRQVAAKVGEYVLRGLRLPGAYWAAAAFVWVFSIAYYMSGVLFEHFPWLDDTIVQLVHAKFILEGRWYGDSHPLPQFFDMRLMINDGKWYSQYPPGHVLVLAVGTALGHAEMVNPFLGACSCIAIYLLAKELYGTHVAKIAVLLAALCTYLIIVSSEYMSNATSLLTGTLFLWAYFKVLHRPGWRYALVGGAMLGYCFITRPYSAFALALPAGLYALYLIVTKPRVYGASMAVMAAVFFCFVAFLLYYNNATTGDALVFGYQKLYGDRHNPFTGEAVQQLTAERLHRNLRFTLQRANYFNRILFEWPLPAMSLVALLFGLRGHRRDERLLLATLLSLVASVQFINNLDMGWGPRLLYEASGILLVLCAKSLAALPPLMRTLCVRRYPLRAYYGGGLIILASFYVFSWQFNLNIPTIRGFYALNNREGNPDFYRNIMRNVTPPALVFVPPAAYKFVSFANPSHEDTPVIFAIDLGEGNEELMRFYPQRNVYTLNNCPLGSNVVKIR